MQEPHETMWVRGLFVKISLAGWGAVKISLSHVRRDDFRWRVLGDCCLVQADQSNNNYSAINRSVTLAGWKAIPMSA